jgi:hypothetical protein
MLAVVPADGEYCLAVWKAAASDLAAAGSYRLHIFRQAVDVPGADLPAATRLLPVRPNPFAGAARLGFDLATPADVRLAVYDVTGARVRTLVAHRMEPGRHEAAWDGRDEAGRAVAAGVYLVRFEAGRHRAVRRIARVW